ncbi:hypothetical protein ScPMuIL_012717 [Solemya velum]
MAEKGGKAGVHEGEEILLPGLDYSSSVQFENGSLAGNIRKTSKISRSPSIEIEIEKLQGNRITLFHTCCILVTMIGSSGIFIVPATLVHYCGSVGITLIVMVITGFVNYSLSKCFAEVAIILPKAGGPYFFIMQVFGRFPAFFFMWGMLFLIVCPVWALLSYTAALYIIQPIFPGCNSPVAAIKLLAICILVLVVVINCLYMKYVSKVQAALSSSKLVAVSVIIIGGIIKACQGETENFRDIFENSNISAGEFALSGMAGMYFFGGWQMITFLMEEMDKPLKTLPRALNLSFSVVILMYVLIMAAYFVVLSPAELVQSDAVALRFMERLYVPFSPVMSILVTATSVGALNACVLGHSRFLAAVASQGHLPHLLSTISVTYSMPWPAIIVLSLLSIMYLVTGTVELLIQCVSVYACIMAVSVLTCLLVLKRNHPPAPDSIRVSRALAVSQLILASAILLMSVYEKPGPMGTIMAILASGILAYLFGVLWKPKPTALDRCIDNSTVFLQKLFVLKSPLSE